MVAKQRCKQFCNSSMSLKNVLKYFNIFALLSFISKVIIFIFYCFIVYLPIYSIRINFRERNLRDVCEFRANPRKLVSRTRKILHSSKFMQSNFFQLAIRESKYSKKIFLFFNFFDCYS